MKILTLNSTDNIGGAAKAAYRIHAMIRNQGIDAQFLVKHKTLDDPTVIELSEYVKKGNAKNVELFIWKVKNRLNKRKWRKYTKREDVFLSDLHYVPLNRVLQKLNYDILHLHWITNQFLDIRELLKVKKPIIWTLHDCWPFTGICHYFYDCERYESVCGCCPMLKSNNPNDLSKKVFEKKKAVYDQCNLSIIAPSRWMADAARVSALFKKFPTKVIPNPIDTILYCPGSQTEARTRLGLDADKKIILFGAMNALKDKNKGFQVLEAALLLLEQQVDPSELELVVFGFDQPLGKLKVKMGVQNLKAIQSDVKMITIYRAADVMVVPSLSENLSNIIMESLSCGTPVTAFNIGGNGDMVSHRQNGYLAQAFSPEDLGTGINWCLQNNQTGVLSRQARATVEQNYSEDIISSQYKALYISLFDSKV
jgi:glycosyltransferase involved in cell wall biosynthesis